MYVCSYELALVLCSRYAPTLRPPKLIQCVRTLRHRVLNLIACREGRMVGGARQHALPLTAWIALVS